MNLGTVINVQLFSLVVATQRSRHSTRVKKMFDYILEKKVQGS